MIALQIVRLLRVRSARAERPAKRERSLKIKFWKKIISYSKTFNLKQGVNYHRTFNIIETYCKGGLPMTWALAAYTGSNIQPFRNLTDDEFAKYKKMSNSIFEFAQDIRIYAFQKANYEDFEKLLKQYLKDDYLKGIIGKIPINPENDKILIEINRYLLNLLSTIRTFLDYAKYNLERRYGKDSNSVSMFKDATHREYSKYFSYRFIYNLRNCAQHCVLPLGINLVSSEIEPYSGNIENSLKLNLDRDSLLNSGYDWRKLRTEIKNLPAQFEIKPYLSEMDKCLDRIQSTILKGSLPLLTQSADYIKSLYKDNLSEGAPCLARFLQSKEYLAGNIPKHTVEILWVPINYIEIIDKLKTVG